MQVEAAFLLILLWVAYFTIHSSLAAESTKAFIRRRWPRLYAHYRLAYNLLALLTLVPPVWSMRALSGPALWTWSEPLGWLADTLGLIAVLGMVAAPTGYDLRRFLGLGDAAAGDGGLAGEGLRLSGIHRFVRHPWYSFALLLMWTREMDLATLLSVVAISAYLILGSRLEEDKLIGAYGDAYRDYRRRVPALIPWPGRVLDLADARRLEAQARRAAASTVDSPDPAHG